MWSVHFAGWWGITVLHESSVYCAGWWGVTALDEWSVKKSATLLTVLQSLAEPLPCFSCMPWQILVQYFDTGYDPPPPSAEVNEGVQLYIYSPSRPSWSLLGQSLHFCDLLLPNIHTCVCSQSVAISPALNNVCILQLIQHHYIAEQEFNYNSARSPEQWAYFTNDNYSDSSSNLKETADEGLMTLHHFDDKTTREKSSNNETLKYVPQWQN